MKNLLLIFGVILTMCLPLAGQIDYDEFKKATQKIYLKDVIIQNKPGSVIEYGAIVIENGIITQLGKNIEKPIDARELKADSLYVYPAFIDAMSNVGFKTKEESKDSKGPVVKFPGAPSNAVAGITPDKLATETLTSSGIKEMREAGFGISHISAKGNMLPGQTAIISLSGKANKDIILKDRVGLYSQLKSSPGVFPSTMIGVITKWKELYKQAEGAKIHHAKYKETPLGLGRPNYEPAVEAFIPVVKKEQKVYFKTPKTKDIHRVLALQKELGFELVLTDIAQAYPVFEKLKSSNATILMSLDLPKKEEEEKKKKEDGEKEGQKNLDESKEELEKKDEKEKEKKEEPVDEELEKLKERKKATYLKYVTQAAEMEKQGIEFGFSWIKAKPKDLHSNIRMLIENGMSEKMALTALTTYPAKVIGVSDVAGTIEKGKLGNLLISDKPYFEEKANIKFMLIDGEIFEYEVKEKKKLAEGEEVEIAGTWNYEATIPGNPLAGKFIITKDGDNYKVTMTREDEPNDPEEIDDVTNEGNNLIMGFNVSEDGFSMDVGIDIDFAEDSFEGSITAGEFGSFPIEGTKVNPE